MTETSCPAPGRLTNYLVLDPGTGADRDHAENVSAIIRAVSPESFLYCKGGHVLPTVFELLGINGNPRIYAVTQSSGSAISNYGIGDRDVDNFVYSQRVLFMKSAGNYGMFGTIGTITSPGKGPNAVTVGNYDHRTNAIWPTSSYVDPNTRNAKPELVAPGVSITAGGHTKTGTSMAAPHVAGIAANFMSAMDYVRNRPALAKAQLMAAARTNVTGGSDKVGVGGARYPEGMENYAAMWWEGTNSSFSELATNGAIYAPFAVSGPSLGKVRVVLTWLNRGTWMYAHQDDVSPLGADFDLAVYDPDGRPLGTSMSAHNPYEIVEFSSTKAGYYWLKITRFANRDTTARVELAAWIHKGIQFGIGCKGVPSPPWCFSPPCNPLIGPCP